MGSYLRTTANGKKLVSPLGRPLALPPASLEITIRCNPGRITIVTSNRYVSYHILVPKNHWIGILSPLKRGRHSAPPRVLLIQYATASAGWRPGSQNTTVSRFLYSFVSYGWCNGTREVHKGEVTFPFHQLSHPTTSLEPQIDCILEGMARNEYVSAKGNLDAYHLERSASDLDKVCFFVARILPDIDDCTGWADAV